MGYPRGLVLNYDYDALGRVARITSNLGAPWNTVADSFLYQPGTNTAYAWRFGNNVPRAIRFDTDGQVSYVHGGAQNIGYSYDNASQLIALQDNVNYAFSQYFAYDAAGRVTSAYNTSNAQTFTVDAGGNRISHERNGATYALIVENDSNRLASWSGNGQSRSFEYSGSRI